MKGKNTPGEEFLNKKCTCIFSGAFRKLQIEKYND